MAPLTLSDIPTLALLYKLGRLHPSTTPVTLTPSASHNGKISHIQHDITKLRVDCIVNAANESLMGGGGVDGAIHRAAGPRLVDECASLDGCATGDAKLTRAYELPCRAVVHAVGPVYGSRRHKGGHEALLRSCYRRSLEVAVGNNLRSIAFSALSTGVYGYPSLEAAEVVIGEVRKFLDEGRGDALERIVFCNFMDKDVRAYDRFLPQFFPPTEDEIKHDDKDKDEDATKDEMKDETEDGGEEPVDVTVNLNVNPNPNAESASQIKTETETDGAPPKSEARTQDEIEDRESNEPDATEPVLPDAPVHEPNTDANPDRPAKRQKTEQVDTDGVAEGEVEASEVPEVKDKA